MAQIMSLYDESTVLSTRMMFSVVYILLHLHSEKLYHKNSVGMALSNNILLLHIECSGTHKCRQFGCMKKCVMSIISGVLFVLG